MGVHLRRRGQRDEDAIVMATVKKGTTVPAPQWWKHLRKHYKRLFWKRQRRADREALRGDMVKIGRDFRTITED